MSEQPLLIECEISEPPVDTLDGYILAASWRGLWWKVFETIYMARSNAEAEAARLPRGWRHRTVLRIRIAP